MLGKEWVVDGFSCDAESLRSVEKVGELIARALSELSLVAVAPPQTHKFPGEGGVTSLVLLTESHLAVHTFPEHRALTLNIYCCKERPTWNFAQVLSEIFGAFEVRVTALARGTLLQAIDETIPVPRASERQLDDLGERSKPRAKGARPKGSPPSQRQLDDLSGKRASAPPRGKK